MTHSLFADCDSDAGADSGCSASSRRFSHAIMTDWSDAAIAKAFVVNALEHPAAAPLFQSTRPRETFSMSWVKFLPWVLTLGMSAAAFAAAGPSTDLVPPAPSWLAFCATVDPGSPGCDPVPMADAMPDGPRVSSPSGWRAYCARNQADDACSG
jgi:hypothetical protein